MSEDMLVTPEEVARLRARHEVIKRDLDLLAQLRAHPHLRYVLKDLECSGEGRGYTECVVLVTKLLKGKP
jgi:hypothetical protein